MGYRKKYQNLEIVEYSSDAKTPGGLSLAGKYAIVDGTLIVSTIRGLSKEECELALPQYEKEKVFVFIG